MGFNSRNKMGKKLLPNVIKIAHQNEFDIANIGIEEYKNITTNIKLHDVLRSNETRYDSVIHSLRFSGNLVFFYNNKGYKAEMSYSTSEHDFYSIEIDSYEGLLNESKRYPKYRVFFILLTDNKIDACWIEHINFHEIRIPKWRALKHNIDTEQYFKDMKKKYQKSMVHFTDEKNIGSGTPYGFINKDDAYIKPFD